MRTIMIEPLCHEAFAPFGDYSSMTEPSGYALCGELHRFFPDRMNGGVRSGIMGFSPILVNRPDEMIITAVEYHTTTWEMILPMNDDMVLHVAPPSAGVPIPQETKAFLVPKGTLVRMDPGVWHLAPLPAKAPQLSAMIVLPACTYANDCTVVTLDEAQQFRLEMPS